MLSRVQRNKILSLVGAVAGLSVPELPDPHPGSASQLARVDTVPASTFYFSDLAVAGGYQATLTFINDSPRSAGNVYDRPTRSEAPECRSRQFLWLQFGGSKLVTAPTSGSVFDGWAGGALIANSGSGFT
jgi:hypothetical protein